MEKLESYFTKATLKEDFEALSDPAISFERDRKRVNDLMVNLVVKYLKTYLGIKTGAPEKIKEEVRAHLEKTKPKGDPFTYFLMTHHYGPDVSGAHDSVHGFPLWCLADLRQTAAILKEIAFNDRFKANGRFIGMDLGAGTGILMLGMAIAAKRRGIKEVICAGAEIRETAVKNGRNALREALGSNSWILDRQDLLKDGNLETFLGKYPPTYWVSETISCNTPAIDLRRPDLGGFGLKNGYHVRLEKKDDPFVEFLAKTNEAVPDFSQRVGEGEVAMFPDPVNGLYAPNKKKSTLTLRTGLATPLPLHEVGKEFEDYEDFGVKGRRWSGKKGDRNNNQMMNL